MGTNLSSSLPYLITQASQVSEREMRTGSAYEQKVQKLFRFMATLDDLSLLVWAGSELTVGGRGQRAATIPHFTHPQYWGHKVSKRQACIQEQRTRRKICFVPETSKKWNSSAVPFT